MSRRVAGCLLAVLLTAFPVLAEENNSPSPAAGAVLSRADQKRVSASYERGNRFLDAKRYAEAERSFLDALKLAPELPAIHHGLGLVYVQTQDYELAVLHLERALRSEPHQVKTLYALSKAYAAIGENEKSKEGYARVIELNPNFEAAHQDLAGIYYREKKWNEALAHLEKARTINPKSEHTLMLIGVTGIQADRNDIALEAVTQLRQIGSPKRARRLEYLIYSSKNPPAGQSEGR